MYTCEQLYVPHGGRLRCVQVSATMAMSCLTTGRDLWHAKVVEGLPQGTELRSAFMDYHLGCIILMVEHESFKLVSGQEMVEPIEVKFERVYNESEPVKFREFL